MKAPNFRDELAELVDAADRLAVTWRDDCNRAAAELDFNLDVTQPPRDDAVERLRRRW